MCAPYCTVEYIKWIFLIAPHPGRQRSGTALPPTWTRARWRGQTGLQVAWEEGWLQLIAQLNKAASHMGGGLIAVDSKVKQGCSHCGRQQVKSGHRAAGIWGGAARQQPLKAPVRTGLRIGWE